MQAEMPFYESAEQAITAAVQHLGGAKAVGALLWPDKSPDGARTRLLDCLNPSRAERLDMSEAMFILKKAKEKAFHAPFAWMAAEIGYEARAVVPAEQEDRLTTIIESATRTLGDAARMLDRLRQERNA